MTGGESIRDELSGLVPNLAEYLGKAGRVDRLMLLFRDDRWLHRRVDPVARTWDGYQRDLEIAWDALDRALTGPEAPALGNPVPCLVRLALVRATLSSADDIPAELLVAAVSTGHWTPERAVATVSRNPSPEQRATLCYALLRTARLDAGARRAIQAQVVELAQMPSVDLPAEALLIGNRAAKPGGADHGDRPGRYGRERRVRHHEGDHRRTHWPAHISELAVQVMEEVPEARRPVLIKRVADRMLNELSRSPGRFSGLPGLTPFQDSQRRCSRSSLRIWPPQRSIRSGGATYSPACSPGWPASSRGTRTLGGCWIRYGARFCAGT